MWNSAVWILIVLICFASIVYLARKNMPFCPPCRTLRLFHKRRPAPQTAVLMQESDSVDERLDRLAEALADKVQESDSVDECLDRLAGALSDKESRCYISKFKILSTKQEMAHVGDGPKKQYRSILDGLRKELSAAEVECRRIQEQIEWVSQRRAELNDEVQLGHRMYGRAVTELASNLVDLQKGRPLCRPLPQVPSYQGPMCHKTSPIGEVVGCRCKKD